MKTLPYDVARCAGRMSLGEHGPACPHRDNCKRYLALTEWDRQAGIPDYRGIPVFMASDNCDHMIEL